MDYFNHYYVAPKYYVVIIKCYLLLRTQVSKTCVLNLGKQLQVRCYNIFMPAFLTFTIPKTVDRPSMETGWRVLDTNLPYLFLVIEIKCVQGFPSSSLSISAVENCNQECILGIPTLTLLYCTMIYYCTQFVA